MATYSATLRRGLPRLTGGDPWPPLDRLPDPQAMETAPAEAAAASASVNSASVSSPAATSVVTSAPAAAVAPAARAITATEVTVRRGLPRTKGGAPWPAQSVVAVAVAAAASDATVADAVPQAAATDLTAVEAEIQPATAGPLSPIPYVRTVFPGAAAQKWNRDRLRGEPVAAAEPRRVGPFTRAQWAVVVLGGGAALVAALGLAVAFVRWMLSLDPLQDFLTTYPGAYALPESAPVGFPVWMNWQHFFNVFFMVLIIRSGLAVRRETRPSAYWAPRNRSDRKINLTLWFHQSLDILWLVNGVAFVVLLFATGHWMRIVPTSWEVLPNALSAGLQYVSLDWPTEHGWVNYNSLQQLAYFVTVFIAAPLAAISGVRMSGIWPKNAEALNRAYPVEWARAVHFPVMLYFVLFIIGHVALVFATGALRNLNHMYGASDSVSWAGFWIFAASLLVIAAAWIAARPLVLAPIARLCGTVSSR